MKSHTKDDLISYRLLRSQETFKEVFDLLDLGYNNTAINRLYYACYYAVVALLLKHNLSSKSHSGVRQMFGLHFVSKHDISVESARVFTELFDKRQKGDYNDFFDFTEEDVRELMKPTEKLLLEIENLIKQK